MTSIGGDRSLYLDLLEKSLLGLIHKDPPLDPWSGVVRDASGAVTEFGKSAGVLTIEPGSFNPELRKNGRDWPATAPTMIGQKRLSNFRLAVEYVITNCIPGDIVETGVWRGGACIMAKGVLKAFAYAGWHNPRARRLFLADSFEGLPPASEAYPADKDDSHTLFAPMLAVSMEEVKANFEAYDLLDDGVVFLKGWFKDTLPKAPIERIAVLRLDGDMYESTMDALTHLYDKLVAGGLIIIDDYNTVIGCHKAVDDFRTTRGITETIIDIDGAGIYWEKSPLEKK